jgi:hypothetical protein
MSDKPQEISERAFEFAVRVVKLCQELTLLSRIADGWPIAASYRLPTHSQ